MRKLKFGVFLYSSLSVCAEAVTHTKVTINNNLSKCIQIDNTEVVYSGDIPLLKISHEKIKTTYECGCKSSISEYTSQLMMDGYNSQLLTGKFFWGLADSQIPIAGHKNMIGDYGVLVSFNCSAPR